MRFESRCGKMVTNSRARYPLSLNCLTLRLLSGAREMAVRGTL